MPVPITRRLLCQASSIVVLVVLAVAFLVVPFVVKVG